MKVKATRLGYYDLVRRREGDVFELRPIQTVDFAAVLTDLRSRVTPEAGAAMTVGQAREAVRRNPEAKWPQRTMTVEEQFSSVWMEPVDAKTPGSVSTAQQNIQRQHDEIVAGRTPQGSRSRTAA